MKKFIGIMMAVVFAATVFSGCETPLKTALASDRTQTSEGKDRETGSKVSAETEDLLKVFPQQVGTEWIYNGFAEYGHKMRLDVISHLQDGGTRHLLTGTVDDMSGGESKKDFSLQLEYTFTAEGIREKIQKGDMMPHKIADMIVLKAPLQAGTKWSQEVTLDGKTVTLQAEILETVKETSDDTNVYKVRYTAKASGYPDDVYVETRSYQEGKGLIQFENTYNNEITFGYSLYTMK